MHDKGWDDRTGAGLLDAAAALKANPKKVLNVKFTEVRMNRDKRKKIESIDVFATIRGNLNNYTLEAGKGKNPSKWKTIAEASSKQLDYDHLKNITMEDLRGSKTWTLRLTALDQSGQQRIARTIISLSK